MARPPEVVYTWSDITQDFQLSVKGNYLDEFKKNCILILCCLMEDLKLGELAHDDLFGLFEAMSAIEMMDPKMDAGMNQISPGSKKVLNFDQAVEAGELELKKVSLSHFIGKFQPHQTSTLFYPTITISI